MWLEPLGLQIFQTSSQPIPLADRTDSVSDIQTDSPPIPTEPILVHCHTCGYSIPPTLDTKCPECGSIWNKLCERRLIRCQNISHNFISDLKAILMLWFVIVAICSIGALGASEGSWESLFFVFFGIGSGVIVSLGVGIWMCKLGPSHQFKLHADLWTKKLWYLHAPWLMIAPLTILGSVIAFIFRFIDPIFGESVMIVVILIELVLWAVLSIASGITWLDKCSTGRRIYGLVETPRVVRIHLFWGVLVWLGSAIVGFFGGVLGSFFMMSLLDSSWMDF